VKIRSWFVNRLTKQFENEKQQMDKAKSQAKSKSGGGGQPR
jgi:hypothetical protein